MNSKTLAIVDLVKQIRPLLAARPAPVQGGALADLLAMWLAGHVVRGDPGATDALRDELLKAHIAGVRDLVIVNAKIIGTES